LRLGQFLAQRGVFSTVVTDLPLGRIQSFHIACRARFKGNVNPPTKQFCHSFAGIALGFGGMMIPRAQKGAIMAASSSVQGR